MQEIESMQEKYNSLCKERDRLATETRKLEEQQSYLSKKYENLEQNVNNNFFSFFFTMKIYYFSHHENPSLRSPNLNIGQSGGRTSKEKNRRLEEYNRCKHTRNTALLLPHSLSYSLTHTHNCAHTCIDACKKNRNKK